MVLPGHLDHRRRQVDAERVEADLPQVGSEPARTAADVGDRSASVGAHQLGEQGQDAALERLAGQGVTEQPGVADCHRVVGRSSVVEPHAEHDILRRLPA
jgi:hypothetical protein